MIAAPLATLGFLLWVRDRTGDLLEPYHLQAEATRRGRTVDPFTGIWNALSEFFDHDRIGPLLHVGWAVIAIALVVVTFRRLPVSYGLFAAATLVIALSSRNLDSFERYAFNAVPTRHRRRARGAQPPPRDARVHRDGRGDVPVRLLGGTRCLRALITSSLTASRDTRLAAVRSWRATRLAPLTSSPRVQGAWLIWLAASSCARRSDL